ncbi:MAG: hypothetical protein ILA02_07750 [Clostridia bacterium]|nr:hypothetical protein [Clostridia bacterium]
MKKIKKYIIIVICLIIILLIATIGLRKNNSGNQLFISEDIQESEDDREYDDSIQISDYFIIKSCVQGYVDALDKTNSVYYVTQENGEQTYDSKLQKQTIYSFLSSSYINTNNITENNIDSFIKVTNEKFRFYPIEIKKMNDTEVRTFKVAGVIQNLEYKNANREYFIVNVDYSNNTFSIQQLGEKEYEKYNKSNDTEKNINNNGNNVFYNSNIDVQKISVEYLNLYKFLTLADPQITFNMMTEEYRNKRFGTLDNYKQYIKDNYEEIVGIYANKYLTNNTEQTIQYVIKDQYENLYIFDVESTMDYTIKLDTYTLDEEKFKTTYNSSDEGQRVQMNIDKFFDMINRQDYRTPYKCLDNTFKKKNFNNEKLFENFVKSKLFKYNKYSVKELKSVGSNTYACRMNISDKTTEDGASIEMTVIIKLLEGTDFVMSFSMN